MSNFLKIDGDPILLLTADNFLLIATEQAAGTAIGSVMV